jgi:hypothetical protein
MRIRLPVKIFLAFLTVAVASIGLAGAANYYFSKRNFVSYLRFKGENTLAVFADTLANACRMYQGWETFRNDSDIWLSLVEERWPGKSSIRSTASDTLSAFPLSKKSETCPACVQKLWHRFHPTLRFILDMGPKIG